MNQHITKRDNLRHIGNASSPLRLDFAELVKRLADDFELSLDGGTQQPVTGIVLEGFARHEFQYCSGRLPCIPEIGAWITLHKRLRDYG